MRHIVRLLLHRALKICKKICNLEKTSVFASIKEYLKTAILLENNVVCTFYFQFLAHCASELVVLHFGRVSMRPRPSFFSEQIVTPFFPYGLTYPLESAFLQGHITVRKRPIVMFRITDQSILSKKKIPLPVLQRHFRLSFFPKCGGRPNPKKKKS